MSSLYGVEFPSNALAAGGEATDVELIQREFNSVRFAHNTFSNLDALERAYDDRIAAIESATGARLNNPLRAPLSEVEKQIPQNADYPTLMRPEVGRTVFDPAIMSQRADMFRRELNQLAMKFPDKTDVIAPGRLVEDDAAAITRTAEERQQSAAASRDDWYSLAPRFIGGAAAIVRDPIQLITMVFGGGVGSAKTVAGRILQTAGKEALINGASETALQPFVQSWRAKAGLPHGVNEAMSDIAMATVAGGLLGGGGRAIGEAVRAVRGVPVAEARTAFGAMGRDANPTVKGALDALDAEDAIDAARPALRTAENHETAAIAGIRAAEDPASIATAFERINATPMERANDALRASHPDLMERLDNLTAQRDINARALADLDAQLTDDARFAPTRRGMIEAEAALARAERLRSAMEKAVAPRERAALAEQATAADREAQRIAGGIDTALVTKLDELTRAKAARTEAQAAVETKLASQRAEVDALRKPLLARFQMDRTRPVQTEEAAPVPVVSSASDAPTNSGSNPSPVPIATPQAARVALPTVTHDVAAQAEQLTAALSSRMDDEIDDLAGRTVKLSDAIEEAGRGEHLAALVDACKTW